jgi:hypothetical protein
MFAGPGAGKSTTAAGLFYKLKHDGYNVELVTEYAKKKTFENNNVSLSKQYYISAKQIYYQELAEQNYDIVITDSPILLGLIYADFLKGNSDKDTNIIYNAHREFILSVFNSKNNYNIFIERNDTTFSNIGRNQDLVESKDIDKKILNLLHDNGYKYTKLIKNKTIQEDYFDKLASKLPLF